MASEILSKHQTLAIERLEQINAQVIQKIPTGVLLIDEFNNLHLANNAARKLLNITSSTKHHIENCFSALSPHLNNWKNNDKLKNKIFRTPIDNLQISVEPIHITNDSKNWGFLIFIEDLSEQAKKTHDLKLVSIGRLTASIAHEIRNPLGAISHAAQLLQESKHLTKPEQRMLDIIRDNAERTNNIIESILNLSKAKTTTTQLINLAGWLEKFIVQFESQNKTYTSSITLELYKNLEILIDPTQLYQILTNLSENGIRYSMKQTCSPYLLLKAGKNLNSVFLDVIDKGPGIPQDYVKYLFEPFFTTETSGTGLGLFIARELCQANNATLNYYPIPTVGCCFRITFPEHTGDL